MEYTQIYLVENCYGDPNKVYIGKEKFPKKGSRKLDHIKDYGNQIIFTFIDKINSLDKKIWKPLETYWIWQFRTWGFDIQNKNEGGGGPEICSNETKRKISESNKNNKNCGWIKGKMRSDDDKQKMRKPKNHGFKISQSLKGKPKHANFGNKQKRPKPNAGNTRIPINQLDLNEVFIKEWGSGKEASIYLGILNSSITQCLKGKNKTGGGFKWRYK